MVAFATHAARNPSAASGLFSRFMISSPFFLSQPGAPDAATPPEKFAKPHLPTTPRLLSPSSRQKMSPPGVGGQSAARPHGEQQENRHTSTLVLHAVRALSLRAREVVHVPSNSFAGLAALRAPAQPSRSSVCRAHP